MIAKALRLSPEQLDELLHEPGLATQAGPHEVVRYLGGVGLAAEVELGRIGAGTSGLGWPGGEIGLAIVHLGEPHSETDDMNRRELLRLFSMTGALLALPSTQTQHIAHNGVSTINWTDAALVSDLAEMNSSLWRVFAMAASKAQVLPLVREQLAVLTTTLAEPHDQGTHQRLCTLAADLFQLAGEIFFDADRYTDAAHCYALAASAGKEAGAFDLWACALTRHAFVAVYDRQFTDAVPMLDLAASLARRGDPALSTRYWVAAVQAETFAGLGELDRCQRALDTAEQVRGLTGEVHNGGWLRFDGSRLAEERGTCYATLGRSDLAESALTNALAGTLTARRRASVLTDLAAIGAQRRDPDQVVAFADAALEAAHQTGSGVIRNKLRTLQPRLAPLLNNTQVRQLNDNINALAG
jgi:tetratricopeptide (TPR) repeat protein